MNLRVNRTQTRADGIFGELFDENNKVIAYTLEHAYLQPDGTYASKTPNGTYTCVKGQHQLHSMTHPFTTYEITGVTGHSNILFHMGNWNNDSDGCFLLGEAIVPSSKGQMVTNSKNVFSEFMTLQNDVDSFQLVVT